MLFKEKFVIPETHRGLLFKDEQFVELLNAGSHSFWDLNKQYKVQPVSATSTITNPVSEQVLSLADAYPERFVEQIQCWETGEHEVGLVYQDNVLKDLKAPAQHGAYWRGSRAIEVRKLNIAEDMRVPKPLASQLVTTKDATLRTAALAAIVMSTVSEGFIGFLEVDSVQCEVLPTGMHVWWQFNHTLKVTQLDTRLQNMEVNGQEILTKDRVGLRINLSALWQVKDAQLVKSSLVDHKDYLYRELQLALRAVVSTQTLDELLADKNLLNQTIQSNVVEKAAAYGLELTTVGVRDIILPGEMKAILAQVVEAEKKAEANLIRRREETQETRSLHNTAKVMEGNPILLRLKELEILEKITGRVQQLNVYGGLDSVMNDLVKLTDRAKA